MGSLEDVWPPTATVERPASWEVACHSADKTGPFQSPPRTTGWPSRVELAAEGGPEGRGLGSRAA
eukprot:718293-Alexandrium_andersonii.AAC.1